MTREEEIRQAQVAIYGTENCRAAEHFEQGASWADAHPHWISVEDELPKEKGWYLVTDGDKFTSTTRWFGSFWGVGYYRPTHWMPLPSLKGGEK